ncbi:hypothetical protein VP1G_09111 [Cytospora mali]|uniref:Ankyrin repeat domain-containing protein 50 n=1 Tax=Cytospora mali TaxID=578113 RepID=A0A194VDK4_CYTMA|nr:hypothetical protein VP1G_09111 [Valsa mali var. pyri (nom. inval.)]
MAGPASRSSTTSTQPAQRHLDLIAASARGNEDKLRSVLREGVPWDSSKDHAALRRALQKASARDNLTIVRLLLEYGADVEARSDDELPALFRAAQGGQTAVMWELLAHDPDLEGRNRDGQTPLFVASAKGFKEAVEMLLQKGARIDAKDRDGRTPLLAVAADRSTMSIWTSGAQETVQLLIYNGADVEARDSIGRTPLLWAATNGHYDLAKILLDNGADVSATNNRGRTALHLVVGSSDETHRQATMKLLLEHQADPRAISDGGWTPLHNAAQRGLTSAVQLLLSADSHVNATLSNGMTPLHWAAFNGFEDVVEAILTRDDVDLGIKDGFGRAPWLCAAEKGHYDLMDVLSPVRNCNKIPQPMQDACKALEATIVEFKQSGEKQRVFKHSVYDLLYGWDHKNDRPKIPAYTANGGLSTDFRWIHLPANNINWIETFLTKWFMESGYQDLETYKALTKCFEQEHRGALPHANFMRPFCHRIPHASSHLPDDPNMLISPPPLARSSSGLSERSVNMGVPGGDGKVVLFMPYLHYETDDGRQKMMDAVKMITTTDQTISASNSPNQKLLQAYLREKPPIHPRRTLDQFFYHGIDTSVRDRDQVVYRYCEKHGHERKIFMVDQLWLWIIGKDLIVSCFPGRWEQQRRDPLNVLDGIIEEMNAKTRAPIRSVYDLAILITSRCSGMFSRHRSDDQKYQFLDMFEASVGRVTEELTQLFHRFEDASAQSQQWLRPKRRHKIRKASNEVDSFDPLLDIRSETSLLTEVRDIRDELNILTMILNSQIFTLGDFRGCLIDELSGNGSSSRRVANVVNEIRKRTVEQERRLKLHKRDIDAMDQQADRLYKSLTDLLDLKQKHSNALEARFASEQALAAAREGQTIMVFTIVTIIFQPMSFITSYFGIDMDSWSNGLSHGFVASWTFGVGLAISVLFILMAFTVVDITKAVETFYSFTKHRVSSGNKNHEQSGEYSSREPQPSYEAVRSTETIVASYDDGLDDSAGTRKLDRQQSKASGVSAALTRTWTGASERVRYNVGIDLEKGKTRESTQ